MWTLYIFRFNNIILLIAKRCFSVREGELSLNNNDDDDDDDNDKENKRCVALKVKVPGQISPKCNHF